MSPTTASFLFIFFLPYFVLCFVLIFYGTNWSTLSVSFSIHVMLHLDYDGLYYYSSYHFHEISNLFTCKHLVVSRHQFNLNFSEHSTRIAKLILPLPQRQLNHFISRSIWLLVSAHTSCGSAVMSVRLL